MTFVFLVVAHYGLLFAQSESYQLSIHILDISAGQPASGVKVLFFKLDEKENWEFITDKCTDTNGRVKDLLLQTTQSNKGVYKLKFHVSSYFADKNVLSIFPFIEVVFEITEDNHYHVPITLSPFGYSTYRGS